MMESEKITASIETIRSYVEQTASFTAEQAPLLVHELLAYGLFVHTGYALAGFALVSGLLLNAKRIRMWVNGNKHADLDILWVPWWIFLLAGTLFATTNVLGVVKILVAPRLYVIQEIMKILS